MWRSSYTWLFRGTPLILQLLLWFNLALIFPTIGIPGLFEMDTVSLMTPFVAALLGLSINQGAYTAEVVRAGLLSVDTGQYEAAKSIGMPRLQALRRIILPQAMRVIIPPVGNEFIGMVKMTSLASVIQSPRTAAQRPEHLLRQRPRHGAADRRRYLVSRRRHDPQPRADPDRARITPAAPARQGGRGERGRRDPAHPNRRRRAARRRGRGRQALRHSPRAQGHPLRVGARRGLCIIGPSGSGKSTLLRCINQLEHIDSGAIWVDGELVGFRRVGQQTARIGRPRRSRASACRIGMVFQRFNLFPHMTVCRT